MLATAFTAKMRVAVSDNDIDHTAIDSQEREGSQECQRRR